MKLEKYIMIIFISVSQFFIGCTVAGLAIGIDACIDEEIFNNNVQIFPSIEINQTIRVITFQNDTIRGEYQGFSKQSFEEYQTLYDNRVAELKDSLILPNLGESVKLGQVVIIHKGQQSYKDTLNRKEQAFFGFVLGGALFSDSDYGNSYIISIESIGSLKTSLGVEINIDNLKALINRGGFPLATNLLINTELNKKEILASDIKEITIEYSDVYWLLGLAGGFAIDAIIFASTFDMSFSLAP